MSIPIVSKPTTTHFLVASSHTRLDLACKEAKRRGALFILYQAENRLYKAVWHVCQGVAYSR